MEFQFSTEDATFQRDLRQFIAEEHVPEWDLGERGATDDNWDRTLDVRRKLADRGWLTMHWPEEYGGQAASPVRTAIFNEAMTYHRAPGRDNFGVRMMGATLMIHGSDEQKVAHLPPVAKGEVQWCQGYSEPESGSDLASLSTRAIRDGDDFVVNGSKIWTSMGHRGDWIMLLTRTDTDAPKHRGISFFLVDMKTPGIEVRPIINMGGRHEFNQIIFDNVRGSGAEHRGRGKSGLVRRGHPAGLRALRNRLLRRRPPPSGRHASVGRRHPAQRPTAEPGTLGSQPAGRPLHRDRSRAPHRLQRRLDAGARDWCPTKKRPCPRCSAAKQFSALRRRAWKSWACTAACATKSGPRWKPTCRSTGCGPSPTPSPRAPAKCSATSSPAGAWACRGGSRQKGEAAQRRKLLHPAGENPELLAGG